ncbi:MAG: hypothetical protein II993_07910, partial [Anaerotignum sp.]|nr:hypothetical protein [Anaerotignum sp.]
PAETDDSCISGICSSVPGSWRYPVIDTSSNEIKGKLERVCLSFLWDKRCPEDKKKYLYNDGR